MNKYIAIGFFLVTWKQQVAHYNDCSWVGNYAVMCYPGCSLQDQDNREEFSDEEQAKEKIETLKKDRNASEIQLFKVEHTS